jgi:hypothetical protein
VTNDSANLPNASYPGYRHQSSSQPSTRIVIPAIDPYRHPGQAKREPGSQKTRPAIYYDPG